MSDKIIGRQRLELLSAQEAVAHGLADRSVRIQWDAATPSADFKESVIHMPPMPEEIPQDVFDVVRGYIDAKTGTLIHTDPTAEKKITSATEFVIAKSLEEGRTNRLMGEALHGCQVNIDRARSLVRDEFEARLTSMEAEGKAGQIGKAILAIGQLAEGKSKAEALDFVRGDKEVGALLDEVGKHLGDLTKLKSTHDSVGKAQQIHKAWKDYLIEPPPPPPSGGGGDGDPDDDADPEDGEEDGSPDGGDGDTDEEEDEEEDSDGEGGGEAGEGDDEEEEDEEEEDEEDGSEDEGESAPAGESDPSDGEPEDESDAATFAEDEDDEEFDPSDEVVGQDEDKTKRGKEKKGKFNAETEGRETKEGGGKTTGVRDADDYGDDLEAADAMSVAEAEECLRKAAASAKAASVTEAMGGKIEVNMKGLHRKPKRPYLAYTENDQILDIENTDNKQTQSWHNEVRKVVSFLRTKLMIDLQGRGKRWRRFQDSGRVDSARLSRVGVGVGTIFQKKLIQTKIDTAMMLVVDLSGSMCGSKVKLALQLAMAFCEACELLDIPNEVVGFTTGYATGAHSTPSGISLRETFSRWEPLKHVVIKPFDKRFAQCRHAFANAAHVGMNQNVDGEAVLWGARRLAGRRESDLRMIVLSDGFPAACECNASEITRHLKFAVKKAEKAGIQTVGIGIQSPAVKQYYEDHVVFNSLEELVQGGYSKIASYFKRRGVKAR